MNQVNISGSDFYSIKSDTIEPLKFEWTVGMFSQTKSLRFEDDWLMVDLEVQCQFQDSTTTFKDKVWTRWKIGNKIILDFSYLD